MDDADAVEAFSPARPAGTALPSAVTAGSPARRLRDAAEPLAMHPVWSRPVNEALAAEGLDFLSSYVWGRAAGLGEPTPRVAAAAFAWFEPGLVAAVYDAGRSAASRDTVLAVRDREIVAGLDEALAGEDLTTVGDLLLGVAQGLDVAGRPLYAGLLDRPLPTSPAGRLHRACELVREARGDGHVAAVVAAGFGAVEANVLTELWLGMALGSYTATRGWPPEALAVAVHRLRGLGLLDGDALSAQGLAAREAVERATDASVQPVVDALGPRLEQVVHALDSWGERCIAAGAFPQDVLERAGGGPPPAR